MPVEPVYDLTFQIQLPDEWNSELGKYNVGITAAVETDKCSASWIDDCNKMDCVIVPSTFTKNVLKRSGILTTPVSVIPEWYHDAIDKETKDIELKLSTDFNFLTVGLLTDHRPEMDRKNLINTIIYFCEKFQYYISSFFFPR